MVENGEIIVAAEAAAGGLDDIEALNGCESSFVFFPTAVQRENDRVCGCRLANRGTFLSRQGILSRKQRRRGTAGLILHPLGSVSKRCVEAFPSPPRPHHRHSNLGS